MARVREPEARTAYLAMGGGRSLRRLAVQLRRDFGNDAPSERTLDNWSKSGDWGRISAEHDVTIASRAEAKIAAQRAKATASAVTVRADDTVVTRDWVLQQLVGNVQQAQQLDDLSPANKALELIGKELGMFVDRREVGQPGEFERLTDAELTDAYTKLQGSIARLGKDHARDAAASRSDKPSRVH